MFTIFTHTFLPALLFFGVLIGIFAATLYMVPPVPDQALVAVNLQN